MAEYHDEETGEAVELPDNLVAFLHRLHDALDDVGDTLMVRAYKHADLAPGWVIDATYDDPTLEGLTIGATYTVSADDLEDVTALGELFVPAIRETWKLAKAAMTARFN